MKNPHQEEDEIEEVKEELLSSDEHHKQIENNIIATDVVMTSEVTCISLGAVQSAPFLTKLICVSGSSAIITAAVFLAVKGFVRADNFAEALNKTEGDDLIAKAKRGLGKALDVGVAPVMKALSVLGTGAMFGIGGELIMRPIPALEHLSEVLAEHVPQGLASGSLSLAFAAATGLTIGAGLVLAHKVAAPIIDPPLAKAGEMLKPVFNTAGDIIGNVTKPVLALLPKRADKKIDAEEPKQP